jgi:DNA polymerase I
MDANKIFLVIDGNSVAHRAFHAMPELTNKNGEAVGAIHGFVSALFRAVEDFRPGYIAVCFDTKAPTFRHLEFKDYKAQRPATAPDLITQLKKIPELLADFRIATFAKEGFEADDLIATVIKKIRDKNQDDIDFYILTGDHDSLQLVDGRVKVFMTNRGVKNAVLYDEPKVKEIFGVNPNQIPDFKALAGDASDNFPGAPGIGPKGAAAILEGCASLEKLYRDGEAAACLAPCSKKTKEILFENKDQILNFLNLAKMRADAPVEANLENCAFDNFIGGKPGQALLNLGLASLAKRLPQGKISRNATLF